MAEQLICQLGFFSMYKVILLFFEKNANIKVLKYQA